MSIRTDKHSLKRTFLVPASASGLVRPATVAAATVLLLWKTTTTTVVDPLGATALVATITAAVLRHRGATTMTRARTDMARRAVARLWMTSHRLRHVVATPMTATAHHHLVART